MSGVAHLYIHLPFCARRCGYCDFYSTAGKEARAPAYLESLLAELEDAAGLMAPLQSVYLGGGTPTRIGARPLARLLAAVRQRCAAEAEITVEANPETVTPALAGSLLAAGATRISLGVQSFSERLRRNLERSGDAGQAARAMKTLRAAGHGNVSLDLIFGIPGQTRAGLEKDLAAALSLEPDHLSCYELSIRPGSGYARRWEAKLKAAGAESDHFYEIVVDILEAAGYRWYETSNFALPGRECRHNLGYWAGADYLGLGAGAWSTVELKRWQNIPDLERYIGRTGKFADVRRTEDLTAELKLWERAMLGLRCDHGADRGEIGAVIDLEQEKSLHRNGFIMTGSDKICLTRAGRFVANEVCARLLRSIEEPRRPAKRAGCGGPGT
jgi:oxygen-independent coproporphyrinogen-3 oxidase